MWSFKAKKTSAPVLKRELGVGGVNFFAGLIDSDEVNSKLTGLEGVATYDLMRRTDAQVAALINTCTLPILSAHPHIERPDNTEGGRITEAHLDFARENLFQRIDFPALLRHACSDLWAGHSWLEVVYENDGDRIVLSKVAPRLASTIDQWLVDDRGELLGIKQYIKGVKTKYVDIPRDKIVLFTYGQEANNYEGVSLLRAVYKPWSVKDALYKYDVIRAERFAVGVPLITLPPDADDDLYDMADIIGKQWKGAEQSHVTVPEGVRVEIISMKGGETLDLLAPIQHHNEEIAKVGLAQFINLGQTETGSRSLGEVTTQFFYDAEEAWAAELAGVLNRDLLWPLMDLNFPGNLRPIVRFSDLGAVALGELVNALKETRDYLPPSLDIENALRDKLNLSPSEVEEEEEEIDAVQLTAPSDVQAHDENDFWRELTPSERHCSLRQMAGMIDDTRDKMMRILLGLREEWIVSLINQVKAMFPDGPRAILPKVPGAMTDEAYDRLSPILNGMFLYGEEQVRNEVASQKEESSFRTEPMSEEETDDLLDARVLFMIGLLSRKTEEAAQFLALDMYRTSGEVDSDLLKAQIEDTTESDLRTIGLLSVTEALNLGRDNQAQKEDLDHAEYSAIMDTKTCGPCAQADGEKAEVGSEKYYDLFPPLNSQAYGRCEGRSNCRCIWVYVIEEQ